MLRTTQQNKSIHVYFRLLAEELNNAGLDQRKVLKPSIAIPWNAKSVKDQLWRPIQIALTDIESTSGIETKDIDRVYDVLNRHLSEKFGLSVPFPSEDELFYGRGN